MFRGIAAAGIIVQTLAIVRAIQFYRHHPKG